MLLRTSRVVGALALWLCLAAATGRAAEEGRPPSAHSAAPEGQRGVGALGRIEPRGGVRRIAGPPRAAVIAELRVEEGDVVQRGDVLALLQDISVLRADVDRARAELAQAERELQRREGLRQGGAAAVAELEDVRNRRDVARAVLARAEAELELSRVRAPLAGQVLAIHAREGERVGADGILDLGDTAAMYVVAEVYETDIGRVRVGQRATVRSDALPHALGGVVERVGLEVGKKDVLGTDPVADTDARVVEVRIRLDDAESAARLTNLRVDVVIEP